MIISTEVFIISLLLLALFLIQINHAYYNIYTTNHALIVYLQLACANYNSYTTNMCLLQ